MKAYLTTKQLKAAIANQSIGIILNDGGGLRGRVRTNRSGKVVIHFEYKYRSGEKSRTVKVEQYPKCSLAQIRRIHAELKLALAKGIDPIEERRAKKLKTNLEQAEAIQKRQDEIERIAIEAASRRSLKAAIEEWQRLELSRRKDGGKEAMRAINKDIIPLLGETPLIDIKKAMIIDILYKVIERNARVMANQLFGDLKQFFNFALTREWIEIHPLAGLTKDKIGGKQKERDRYLSEKEITELKQKLPSAKLLLTTELSIWIMLSTCCRVGELSKSKWKDVDLKKGIWTIPMDSSKNAKQHTVFLSSFALGTFNSLFELTGNTDWCFPSRDPKNHINEKSISKQLRDRVREAPLPGRTTACGTLQLSGGDWTPHDLRRTGATMMGELGVMGEVIEKCLNHAEHNKLKRIYQRHELKAEQQEAWKLLGDRIELIISQGKNSNIVLGSFS